MKRNEVCADAVHYILKESRCPRSRVHFLWLKAKKKTLHWSKMTKTVLGHFRPMECFTSFSTNGMSSFLLSATGNAPWIEDFRIPSKHI